MNGPDALEIAAHLIDGERARQHGDAHASFDAIANMWSAWLGIDLIPGYRFNAHDALMMMALLKVARMRFGEFNRDDYIDALGYIALALQVAEKETGRTEE